MHIHITEKLRPFSHIPGASCLLPGSHLQVQIFPTLIRLYHLSGELPHSQPMIEVTINVAGPVKNFTILLDLEKGLVRVWGDSTAGYFRYNIRALSQHLGIAVEIEKAPKEGLRLSVAPPYHAYRYLHNLFVTHDAPSQTKEVLFISCHGSDIHDKSCYEGSRDERLSLGNHKAQDWDMVRRRNDMTEILPLWLALAGVISKVDRGEFNGGTFKLLELCQQALQNKEIETLNQVFNNLFLAGFHHIMIPRIHDDDYQGLVSSQSPESEKFAQSPLSLLHESANLVKALFIQYDPDEKKVHLLPVLPVELHCGRFINLTVGGLKLDFEWSKKSIKRVIVRAIQGGQYTFIFQKHVKSFRMREEEQGHNEGVTAELDGTEGISILLETGKNYFIDNFK